MSTGYRCTEKASTGSPSRCRAPAYRTKKLGLEERPGITVLDAATTSAFGSTALIASLVLRGQPRECRPVTLVEAARVRLVPDLIRGDAALVAFGHFARAKST